MSDHGHQHEGAISHTGHDDHAETSSDDFPADEPSSPAWLPLLGGALLLVGIFAFVALGSAGKTADELTKDAASANPSPVAASAAPLPSPAQRPSAAVLPGGVLPQNRPKIARPAGN